MNANLKVSSLPNPLSEYLSLGEQIKVLERKRSALKEQIFSLMDLNQADEMRVGDFKAKRQLIVQKKINSEKVKAFLQDDVSKVEDEIAYIKLVVV